METPRAQNEKRDWSGEKVVWERKIGRKMRARGVRGKAGGEWGGEGVVAGRIGTVFG